MGVHDLMAHIRRVAPQALRAARPAAPTFKAALVDTPLLVMAGYKRAQAVGELPYAVIQSSLRSTVSACRALGADDVHFVFDGPTRAAKRRTVATRLATARRENDKVANTVKETLEMDLEMAMGIVDTKLAHVATKTIVSSLASSPRFDVVFPDVRTVTRATIDFVADWAARDRGVLLHIAPHDSEEWIARHAGPDLVVSIDSDALAFGCRHIVMHLGQAGETWVDLEDVLAGLGMSQERFRWFCVLLGNDFSTRLRGVGPVNASRLVTRDDWDFEAWAAAQGADEAWRAEARDAYDIFSLK